MIDQLPIPDLNSEINSQAIRTVRNKIREIITVLNTLTEQKQDTVQDEWPMEGSDIWAIAGYGEVISINWEPDNYCLGYSQFLGIYRTREEAEAALERIKTLLKK